MTIIARFGAAQTGLGYQFINGSGTLLGSRTTSGITALAEAGSYIATATPPDGSVAVYWNSTVSGATALEDLREAFAIAALEAAGGGNGAYSVTVTVTDGTDPLEGAKVRVTEGITTLLGVTDASGNYTFALDAATYTVAVTKAGYGFDITTRTVTGEESGTLVDDLEMTAIAIPGAPADPTLCTVYFDTGSIIGSVVSGVVVTFTPVRTGNVSEDGRILTRTAATATSNGSGRGTVDLERGVPYNATCETLFGERTIRVTPDGDTLDLATLL